MARGGDDAGVGDGEELSLRLGTTATLAAPATATPRNSLTIVYDRRVLCAVDVVELQAMAIISTASRETATGEKGPAAWRASHAPPMPASPEHGGFVAPAPIEGDQAGLSMKRSLQRFLEKRKARGAAASPYGVPRPAR